MYKKKSNPLKFNQQIIKQLIKQTNLMIAKIVYVIYKQICYQDTEINHSCFCKEKNLSSEMSKI